MSPVYLLLILVLLTEATTQLVTKSSITYRFRLLMEKTSTFFGELFNCSYCFSVWASIFWNCVFFFIEKSIIIVDYKLLNVFILIIIVHRLSNYLHGLSDRFFDTQKDIRYTREE